MVPVRVEVHELGDGEVGAAAAVLARALRDNPLHVRAFGLDPGAREESLEKLFDAALRHYLPEGSILGAFFEERLVGACAYRAPSRCRASARAAMSLAPDLLANLGVAGAARLVRWVAAWSRHDPGEAHVHLGPVGVERPLQGRGVGSCLLEAFRLRMDASRFVAYLETDRPENVAFYRRFGFQIVAEDVVLGVPNWFMMRGPVDGSWRPDRSPALGATARE
jgi:ribosomal protein S18 acetylase RimI-like enzyme